MANKVLTDYIQKSLLASRSTDQIVSELTTQGWAEDEVKKTLSEIQTAATNLPAPPPPEKSKIDIDLKSLTASQILLYLGALIILLAGVIFVGINWQSWGAFLHVLAIFIPLVILYAFGIPLWYAKNRINQAIAFLFAGSLLFPLFLGVLLVELNLFPGSDLTSLGLTITLASLILYLAENFLFRYPIWTLAYGAAGLFFYYFLWSAIGIDKIVLNNPYSWLFVIPGILYVLLGYYYEITGKKDWAKYPYGLGFVTLFLALGGLAMAGSIVGIFIAPGSAAFDPRFSIGWSSLIIGVIYLAISSLLEIISRATETKYNLKSELTKYVEFFSALGTIAFLGAILSLSLGSKQPIYETLLLFSSLGFIFASIPKQSRHFLYIGTFFLVVYIFDIGGEYFQDQVGWPLTLFVAGLLSMVVGLGIDQIKKRYLSKK